MKRGVFISILIINNHTTMKNNIAYFLLSVITAMTLTSCEKYTSDTDYAGAQGTTSTLTIRTRVATTNTEGDAKVSYPVNIYVFNSKNICVATTVIEKESTPVSLKLPEGNYDVCAIAGADAANYELPSQEEATKEYIVSLREGCRHADIMTAQSTVNMAFGEENTLTLTLARKVMMLEETTINNVPENVIAVSLTITPIYEGIRLNGKYGGENGSHTVVLSHIAGTDTWKNTTPAYLPEASGPATIKVSLTTATTTKSYSYSCTDDLKANYKIRITGTYTDKSGITLNGTVTGATWNGTKDITFDFDESGSTTGGNNPNPESGDNEQGEAPAAGTLYKGCYVLKSVTGGNGTTVTLVSTGSRNALTFTRGDQQSMQEAVNGAIAELATDGIAGWRLPKLDEMVYIKENIETINNNLTDLGQDIIVYKIGGSVYSYFFMTSDGDINTYNISRGDTDNNPNSGLKTVILRAFATLTFNK